MVGVVYTDYHIFDECIKVDDALKSRRQLVLPEGYKSDEEYIEAFKQQTVLDKISVLSKERVIQNFEEMLGRMFEKTGINESEISYFISVDLYSNSSEDISICSYLHKKYNISNAVMFSLHQGCGSTFVSMGLAQKLLDEDHKYMLIISSCFVPSLSDWYIGTTVVGDGLGLILIGNTGGSYEIIDSISVSDGKISYDTFNNVAFKPNVLSVVIKGIGVIKSIIKRNGLTLDEISQIIPQNINYQKYSGLYTKMLNIGVEKIYLSNISNGGHLGDADIIRNLRDYFGTANVQAGEYYLLYGIDDPQGKDKSYNCVIIRTN